MTNEEKYKTPEKRLHAFIGYCGSRVCSDCQMMAYAAIGKVGCMAHWLALEADEEMPLTCPFCGGYPEVECRDSGLWHVYCKDCYSKTTTFYTKDKAIAAWNRRAK